MTTLHVDGARVLTDDDADQALANASGGSTNVAATADGLARSYAIAGDSFTFKADGEVLDPAASMPADVAVLELVEHVNDEIPTAAPVDVAVEVDDGDDDQE